MLRVHRPLRAVRRTGALEALADGATARVASLAPAGGRTGAGGIAVGRASLACFTRYRRERILGAGWVGHTDSMWAKTGHDVGVERACRPV